MGLLLGNELKQFSAKINLFANKKKLAWKCYLQNIGHFVWASATYTISHEICTRPGCALFCCGHNIINSWHTVYSLGLLWDLTHWSLGDLNNEIRKQFFKLFFVIDDWGIQLMSLDLTDHKSTLVYVMACAVRQKAIKWVNIDPVLCRQMASPGHNELINWWR